MNWLSHPTVAARYAAFRATLQIKVADDAFGARATNDPPHRPAPDQTPRKVREIHNVPKRKTD